MQIADFISKKNIISNNDCYSKKDAFDKLAKIIAHSDNSISQTEVFDCLITRERLGSTGLGKGVAIPHGKLKHSKKILAAFLRLETAIDYDAIDKQPVDLLFALITPEQSTDEHLKILAKLAEIFSNGSVVNKLRQSKTEEEICSILTQ